MTTHALGWALIHFLWQAVIAAGLLAILLVITRDRAPQLRYVCGVITLALMLALPVFTAVRLSEDQTEMTALTAAPAFAPSKVAVSQPAPRDPSGTTNGAFEFAAVHDGAKPLGMIVDRWLPTLVVIWGVGVLLLSVRLLGGIGRARRLRTEGTREPPASCRLLVERLSTRLQMTRAVRALESTVVRVPAVVGFITPVILLPASVITGLSPQQLEVLLAHELAHVRRHDSLVNLFQAVVETLLFYHPAVWWVSGRIREAREHCCDDVAVSVCQDAEFYAKALLRLEELRGERLGLAVAATGGSLLTRIRRVLHPGARSADLLPRWAAGAAALTAVLFVGASTTLSGTADRSGNADTLSDVAHETASVNPPDTVIRHPDPRASLDERWAWAAAEARRGGFDTYWIGYEIQPLATLNGESIFVARIGEDGLGRHWPGIQGRMRIFDRDGPREEESSLRRIIGTDDPQAVALLFAIQRGQPVGVWIASMGLSIGLDDFPVLWLGGAPDGASIALVERLFAQTSSAKLREDLTSALGVHNSSDAVAPLLISRLDSRESDDIREEAADWLGWHPTPGALHALARASRSDRSIQVRREAAEALGYHALPEATDTLIALAQTLDDARVREEAIEALGDRKEARVASALAQIALTDPAIDLQREAVETLGDLGTLEGLGELARVAFTHPAPEARAEALETIADAAPPARALQILEEAARDDPSAEVRREAIESIGDVRSLESADILERLARTHPDRDVRMEAVETLVETTSADRAVAVLDQIAAIDPDVAVQREAVESLEDVGTPAARAAIARIAREHPRADVRREAVETVADAFPSEEAVSLLRTVAEEDFDSDVRREAVETLGEIRSPRALDELERIARHHVNRDIRHEAIESLGEHGSSDRIIAILRQIAVEDPDRGVQHEALEALAEMHSSASIDALIDLARTHPVNAMRLAALELLAESDEPKAREAFDKLFQRP